MKKRITLFLIMLLTTSVWSQDINLDNASTGWYDCNTSGNFYDEGGSTASYNAGTTQRFTLCSPASTPIAVEFVMATFGHNLDYLAIYDGDYPFATLPFSALLYSLDQTNIPPVGTVFRTSTNNTSGCLTFDFVSNAASSGGDFEFKMRCLPSCKVIQANRPTANIAPFPQFPNYIHSCTDDTVVLTGSGTYDTNTSGYVQHDTLSQFYWDFGGLGFDTGRVVKKVFPPGIYPVRLVVEDSAGCKSVNSTGLGLRQAIVPNVQFNPADTLLCLDDEFTVKPHILSSQGNKLFIGGNVGAAILDTVFAGVKLSIKDTAWLPDDSDGILWNDSSRWITYDFPVLGYQAGAIFTDTTDLVSICLDIEHSYVNDIDIIVTCPNGTSLKVVDFYGGVGFHYDFGEPVWGVDSTRKGVPYTYCWSPSANPGDSIAGGNSANIAANLIGPNSTAIDTSIMYSPSAGAWGDLIGCPMNGNWSISVFDDYGGDDGNLFGASIEFSPEFLAYRDTFPIGYYDPMWTSSPQIISPLNQDTAKIKAGLRNMPTFTLNFKDSLGCNWSYDYSGITIDSLNIDIKPKDTMLCYPHNLVLDATVGKLNNCDGEYVMSSIGLNMLSPSTSIGLDTLNLADSELSANLSLPFNFDFFCETKNEMIVSSNGYVAFKRSSASAYSSGQRIPSPSRSNELIALAWADLDPDSGNDGTIRRFTAGSAPNRVQVIEFIDVPYWNRPATVSGQIHLYEATNVIEIHCQDCQLGRTATLGIENKDGTVAYSPDRYNRTIWSANSKAWRFTPSNSIANYQLTWSPNYNITSTSVANPVVNPDTNTTYYLDVVNQHGCKYKDSTKVSIFDKTATVTTISEDLDLCGGATAQLNATGGSAYVWTPSTGLNNPNIANPIITAGDSNITYYLTYTITGCTKLDSVKVNVLPSPDVEVNNGINPVTFCKGTSKELSTPLLNGWTYQWSGPQNGTGNSLNASIAGKYILTYSDGNCTGRDTVELSENPSPNFNHDSYKHVVCCTDDSVSIIFSELVNNVAINQVQINDEVITGTNGVTYTSSDFNGVNLYKVVKVTSTKGCSDTAILRLSKNCLNPDFTHPDTVYLETGEEFKPVLGPESIPGGVNTYHWVTTDASPGAITDNTAENAIFNGVQEGVYTATVKITSTIDGVSCTETSDAKNYEVVLLKDPQYPDAFTPNADNRNDLFRPVMSSLAKLEALKVYNRWGDLMYDLSTATNKDGWDGVWNGKLQPSDLYIYYTKIKHPDGKEFIKEGSFMLIR